MRKNNLIAAIMLGNVVASAHDSLTVTEIEDLDRLLSALDNKNAVAEIALKNKIHSHAKAR